MTSEQALGMGRKTIQLEGLPTSKNILPKAFRKNLVVLVSSLLLSISAPVPGAGQVCVDSCQTAYNNIVAICEQTYDPAICGGDTSCEQLVLEFRNNCISSAEIGLNQCRASQPTDTLGPITSNVAATPNPVAVNVAATLTADASDATTGGSSIASAQYSLDGGLPVQMAAGDSLFDQVSESVTAQVGLFSNPGLHNICVDSTDRVGNTGGAECTVLAVYDPTGAFVTGGGSIESPSGADLANSSAAGPARFGFVSKYLPGRSIPDGNLEFQFQAGDLNFKSTSMDWLVVTGEPRGRFQGNGKINGSTECKFVVDAWDGSYSDISVSNVDAFGLRLFACGGALDSVHRYWLEATPLTKGSIIIHKK